MNKVCIQLETIYGPVFIEATKRIYRLLILFPFIIFLSLSSIVMRIFDSHLYLKVYSYSAIYLSFFSSSLMTLIVCYAVFFAVRSLRFKKCDSELVKMRINWKYLELVLIFVCSLAYTITQYIIK